MRKLISPHLSIREVRCRCGCKTGGLIDPYAASLFELIREDCSSNPLIVSSAWRCIKHNKSVGGHQNSLHLRGMALDLLPPKWMALDEFYAICDRIVADGGLGKYLKKGFCHIDCGNIVGLQKYRRWVK